MHFRIDFRVRPGALWSTLLRGSICGGRQGFWVSELGSGLSAGA